MSPARILLVGGQRAIGSDPEEMLRFHEGLFGRLTREVKGTGPVTRYVGFQGPAGDGQSLHFLGLEVEGIADIPEGMVAWDLDGGRRTVWHSRHGREVIAHSDAIEWQWLVESQSAPGRWCGEPTGLCLSANAYVAPGRQADSDEVALVDYDPSWPGHAQEMAAWLREQLGPAVALRVEHYGSTAIPGMPAKPVVDLLVEVPSFLEAKKSALRVLNAASWEYWWYSQHMTFVKRTALMGRRTHHVHMAPAGHEVWNAVVFRDYLRSDSDEAARYAALKRELAAAHRADRERYALAKTQFVREVTERALRS